MSSSPPSVANAVTPSACECVDDVRSSCAGEDFYKIHNGKRYCVLHYPGKKKIKVFNESLKRKIDADDFDFKGVWFPDELTFQGVSFIKKAEFSSATFNASADFYGLEFKAEVDFSYAKFNAEVYFSDAIFKGDANFRNAKFGSNADFIGAVFKAKADFAYTKFSGEANFDTTFDADVNFLYASFAAEAYFRYAVFKAKVNFRSATFCSFARFGEGGFSSQSSLDLQHARIEKPDHTSFHTLILRPHWFVNVDARKFDFTNIEWQGNIEEEIKELRRKKVSVPHRLLASAFRNLAVNAEDNDRYEEASKFRYMAMDVRRLENLQGTACRRAIKRAFVRLKQSLERDWGLQGRTRKRSWRFSKAYWRSLKARWQRFKLKEYVKSLRLLHSLYWAASGYGERIFQALAVLFGIWLLSALLYTTVGFARWEPKLASEGDAATAKHDEVGTQLRPLSRALVYSLGVMTLQKPEPKPATTTAQAVVMLETILGPVQAALLALAIRRKFMR